MAATFELYQDKRGEYRWRLRHANGQILATAGEGFTRKENAKKSIEGVKRNATDAVVKEIATKQK
ncbi:YegP family protein [Haloarchaeobius sp. DFWS5]|uniref:YegP family protein n=1 Tax=Haloarchaeobius sp. DFWS5 TaxID=3446114 RepID=UPI003EBE3D8F